MSKRVIAGITVISVLLISGALTYILVMRRPAPATSLLTPDSVSKNTDTSSQVMISSQDDNLFSSQASGEAAARDFILNGKDEQGKHIFPSNIEITTSRSLKEDKAEHYYFQQKINDIPVYGGNIAVHIKNGSQIYATEGKVVKNIPPDTDAITEEQAKTTALEQAKNDYPETELSVVDAKPWIMNTILLGIGEEDKNKHVLGVKVESASFASPAAATYYVNLADGVVVHVETNVLDARNRIARDGKSCTNSKDPNSCRVIRTENAPATGDSEVDNVFDIVGKVYDYYKNTFNLDSFDGKGTTINIMARYPMQVAGGSFDCKNAFWSPQFNLMAVCIGMGFPDILSHEFTHGVTIAASGLDLYAQAGAMNESISDLIATSIDNNWTIGEGSPIGTIRYLNDPMQKNHPDKLFSNRYYCPNTSNCTIANDYCGVHYNSGVLNKTGYLIAEGGNFNGCAIQGLGKEKMRAIVHRASTVYLTKLSNFTEMASALQKACKDLYSSTDCEQVTKAVQATEMDQQEFGQQLGSACRGKTAAKPACATGGNSGGGDKPEPTDIPAQPTSAPQITQSTGITPTTSAAQPTSVPQDGKPGQVGKGCVPKYKPDRNGCEQPTLYTPSSTSAEGEVTFSWCTSTTQAGFNFRMDYNANNASKPDVVKDRMPQTALTLKVPLGKHAWWVHSFCQDGKDGYLSNPSGTDLSVVRKNSGSGTNTGSGGSSTQPLPTTTPTTAPGGINQRSLDIN